MSRFVSATRGTHITEFATRYQDALLLALTLEWGPPKKWGELVPWTPPGHSRSLCCWCWPAGGRQLELLDLPISYSERRRRILRLTARDTDLPLIAALQDQFPGRKRAAGRRP